MIVLDASAFVELAVSGSRAAALRRHAEADSDWVAPEHFVVEAANAFRRLWLAGLMDDRAFASAAARLGQARVSLRPVRPLLARMVELAANITAYDAAYIALAEALDAPFLTTDKRLRAAPGTRCRFLG